MISSKEKILLWVLCCWALGMWSSQAARLWTLAQPLHQLQALDNDSAAAVEVSLRTRFYNDNGWRTYGPVYYKIQTLGRWLLSWSNDPQLSDPDQIEEKKVHFILMLINLASLWGFVWLLSGCITREVTWRISFLVGWIPILLHHSVRAEMVSLAKPDLLFCFLFAFACLQWVNYLENPTLRALKKMSGAFGLASATKLASLYFLPAFLTGLLRRSENSPRFLKRLQTFVLSAGTAYFAFGFVETWDVPGTLQYLIPQSRNTRWGDWEFLKIWGHLSARDLQWTSLGILIFVCAAPRFGDSKLKKSTLLWAWSLLALASFQLFSKRMNPPYEWYPLPFWNGFFLLLAWSLKNWLSPFLLPNWTSLLFPLAVSQLFPSSSKLWDSKMISQASCREPIQKIYDRLAVLAESKRILADPMIPYPRRYHDRKIWGPWDLHWKIVEARGAQVLALRKDTIANYLPRGEGGTEQAIIHTENLEMNREFYRNFFHPLPGLRILDPLGQNWKLDQEFDCGFQIWIQEENNL